MFTWDTHTTRLSSQEPVAGDTRCVTKNERVSPTLVTVHHLRCVTDSHVTETVHVTTGSSVPWQYTAVLSRETSVRLSD